MIGIDTVNVERLRRTFGRTPAIEARLFSHHERMYCRAKADPVMHFAGTLAAKEAVIKARGLGPLAAWTRRIEITRAENGAPIATIKGGDHGPIHLSISHDGPVAVAVAIAQSAEGLRPRVEATDEGDHPLNGRLRPNENLRRYIGSFDPAKAVTTSLVRASQMEAGTDYP